VASAYTGSAATLGVQHRQRGGDTYRPARGLGRDRRRQLGVRSESPGAVNDDPHRQADLTADHRGLELTVAQLDDLGVDAVNSQVGVAGPGGGGRRQCGFGELVSRQV
jgi:hypothetical protein